MSFLSFLARNIDAMNEHIGRFVSWAALLMVLVQFAVVMMRKVFGLGSQEMQESIVYMHAIMFMVAAGYTLLHDSHVRVDIFYGEATERRKAWVNLGGVVVFLIPTCVLIWWVSWPYVSGSWAVLEGSQEGGSGIPAVFLLKTVILVFAVLLPAQGVSLAARSLFVLTGFDVPPPKDQDPEGASL